MAGIPEDTADPSHVGFSVFPSKSTCVGADEGSDSAVLRPVLSVRERGNELASAGASESSIASRTTEIENRAFG